MPEICLNMSRICKSFTAVRALDDVSFDLRKGEIHALVGENGAGKSTLMKILGGVYQADSGEITIGNEKVSNLTPIDSINRGVSIIYQEFNLVPTLSIAENIFLGKEKTFGHGESARLDRKTMNSEAKKVMARLNMADLDVTKNVSSISVAHQQLVEIGKALLNNSEILVMDEPTAVLSPREANGLFDIMNLLREQGMGIVFISHRLEEIQRMADRITVLRDGQLIATLDNSGRNINQDEIVSFMVGRKLTDYYPPKTEDATVSDEVILKVDGLSTDGLFEDISFELHKGEILGLSGLVGAGRTEVGKTIFGAYKKSSGKIYIDDIELNAKSIDDVIASGITLVPEDRKTEGLVLMMTMEENIALPNSKLVSDHGVINSRKRHALSDRFIDELSIRPGIAARKASEFSGGNQQKIVIAKWLATEPKVLILDEPTRGVDVGAKTEIYTLMRKMTEKGVAIIFISSEMPELLGMCDRMLVMHEGHLTGEFDRKDFDQQRIMRAASGI